MDLFVEWDIEYFLTFSLCRNSFQIVLELIADL